MKSMIGATFTLTRSMLGNPAGVIGYVFNQYPDFDDSDEVGVQVIFPNGNYDGFSAHEQKDFLHFEGFDSEYVDYEFENVMQVSRDFRDSYWKWE